MGSCSPAASKKPRLANRYRILEDSSDDDKANAKKRPAKVDTVDAFPPVGSLSLTQSTYGLDSDDSSDEEAEFKDDGFMTSHTLLLRAPPPSSMSAEKKAAEPSILPGDTVPLLETHQAALEAVCRKGTWLKNRAFRHRDNLQVVMGAVQNMGIALEFASERLRDNQTVVIAACRQNGTALQFASERLRSRKEVILVAMEVKFCCCQAAAFASIPMQQDHDILLKHVLVGYISCYHRSQYLKEAFQDRAFLLKALKALQGGGDLSKERVRRILLMCDISVGDDVEVVTLVVRVIGLAFPHISPRILQNREVVMAAVSSNGRALAHAPTQYQNDYEIVSAATASNVSALEYASSQIKQNKEFIKDTIARSGWKAYRYAEFPFDLDIVFLAMKRAKASREFFQDVTEELRSNRQVMMAAVKCDGLALQWAAEDLRDDTELVMAAVVSDTDEESDYGNYNDSGAHFGVLQYASPRLRGDETVVLVALAHNPYNVEYVHNEPFKRIAFTAKALAALERGIDNGYNVQEDEIDWDDVFDSAISRRISRWLESYEYHENACRWLEEEDPANRCAINLGATWMRDACEKRWILHQVNFNGTMSLPGDVQTRIFAYSDIEMEAKAALETMALGPILTEIFKPTQRMFLDHFRDAQLHGLVSLHMWDNEVFST